MIVPFMSKQSSTLYCQNLSLSRMFFLIEYTKFRLKQIRDQLLCSLFGEKVKDSVFCVFMQPVIHVEGIKSLNR